MQSPGWLPPAPTRRAAQPLQQSEPTGIGAVVTDTTGDTWVRIHNGEHPWVRAEEHWSEGHMG